ncbi:MAG: ABC transporter ATP-binding protein/permease [Sphaerochaetaceae bacterium]|nr:ABC transporter ATP-binding protein/permease [Sphaerochaetaceae bacterium]
MREFLPIIIVGAVIGAFTIVFAFAYFALKKRMKDDSKDRHIEDKELIRRMVHYAKPHWKSFLVILVVMIVSIVFDIVSPLIVGEIQGTITSSSFTLTSLRNLVILYASMLVVSMVCTYIQALLLQKIGQKILSAIRMDTFTHIEKLSHAQLSQIPVGKLVTRVSNDPNAISYLFTNILVTLVKNVMVIIGVLGAMLVLNYALTIMVLCFVPFLIAFTMIFRKFSRHVHRQVNNTRTNVNTFLSENLSGMKVTQIFNQTERKRTEFNERSKNLENAKYKRMFVFGVFRPMVYMLYVGSNLFLFYFACRGYIKGTTFFGSMITSQVVVEFYMYISRFFNPIQAIAEQFDMLEQSFASAEKIFSIMDMVPEVVDEEDAIELDHIEGEIEFRDVWFQYKPDEWVLKGVSFHVMPRQTVAFVGSTGSGKSTILSLICRNYDIQKGQILIDGIDIKHIKISSLRKHFGQMLQDVFLFSGDIRSNIVLRDESMTDEQVMEACRYVNADSFINRMDNGLDEVVRERGNNFSAGQRQLLSFARTIIHKPSVMILDEATANIDTETELLIQDSLEKMKNIGTMLIVAHRLSTIQHADNILVLSHGQIIEQGNHQDLLKQKGRYFQLYTIQHMKQQLQ